MTQSEASNRLVTETIPLAKEDARAEPELRRAIAKFWSEARGAPRDIYDRFIGASPSADGVGFEEVDYGEIRGWWCRPQLAKSGCAILFVHGGAYIQGSPTASRGFASQIAARAQVVTLVIGYPLAPEHPVPAAPEAAVSAYRWLKKQGFENVAVVGESAGGGLALVTLAQIAADKDLPQAVAGVVLSPWTDLSLSGASMTDPCVEDPILSRDMLADAAKAYLGSADARDPLASPLFGSFAGLPPLLIQVGSDEILLDDSMRFARAASDASVPVTLEIWNGLHHVFQLNNSDLLSARRALDRVGLFLGEAFGR
jgi:monoterpene epsilon-lactone hydrolase